MISVECEAMCTVGVICKNMGEGMGAVEIVGNVTSEDMGKGVCAVEIKGVVIGKSTVEVPDENLGIVEGFIEHVDMGLGIGTRAVEVPDVVKCEREGACDFDSDDKESGNVKGIVEIAGEDFIKVVITGIVKDTDEVTGKDTSRDEATGTITC